MQTDPKLIKGDTIALCATARFVEQDIIDQAIYFIENLGYKVVLAENLSLRHHQMAGNDISRAQAFQKLLLDTEVKAIWCLRGGFGGLRIIDQINFDCLQSNPKLLIGFSDFTSILNHVANLGVKSIHGPMPIQLSKLSALAINSFKTILQGENLGYNWPSNQYNKFGKARGKLVGGNLSVLYSTIGSLSFPHLDGAILFLEDLDEYLYHIDRMLFALKRSGALKGLKGVVIGSFSDLHDHKIPFGQNIKEIILEFFDELEIPIAFNFPAGHQNDNRCLILGEMTDLMVSENSSTLK